MKLRLLLVLFCLTGMLAKGQTKVGTVDSELIVGLMPEMDKVVSMLGQYAKRLDSSYQQKVKEYQGKVAAYQKLKGVSDEYKKIKVQEIGELEKGLQQSQQNGSQLVQLKRNELMRPLYKKISNIIAEIAKAEGYTQILTTSGNEFAFVDPKYDLTEKIMNRLGIKIPEQPKE